MAKKSTAVMFIPTITQTWLEYEKVSEVETGVIGVYTSKKDALESITEYVNSAKATMFGGWWELDRQIIDDKNGYVELIFGAYGNRGWCERRLILEITMFERILDEKFESDHSYSGEYEKES